MWWYGYGWWWWWMAFLVIFFVLPLSYGWGYRGWGPWYRRGGSRAVSGEYPEGETPRTEDNGWGWGGVFLWIVLAVCIVWLIAAFSWAY